MGVYRVSSPYAAQMRAIKRREEKDRKRDLLLGQAERRSAEQRGAARLKEASAAARSAEQALRLDNLYRQIEARKTPRGIGEIRKFLWHGELPAESRIKARPADLPPGAIARKKDKRIPVEDAYQIILKGRPVPDMADPNESMMSGLGLPDVPEGRRQFIRQPIPGAGPTRMIRAGINPQELARAQAANMGQTAMGGELPYAEPLSPGPGYDITAPAQTMLSQYQQEQARTPEPPLNNLYQQLNAMGGGKAAGKSKMADFQSLTQALQTMGQPMPSREEVLQMWGALPKQATGLGGLPMPKIKGEGGAAAATTPTPKPSRVERRRITTMREITADPMLVARIKQQLAAIGLTMNQIQVDEKGPFVIDPRSDRVMRFNQVQGAK